MHHFFKKGEEHLRFPNITVNLCAHFLYTQILEIWSHAESLDTSPARGWWHSYEFHECQCMCFPKQLAVKRHSFYHLALHNEQRVYDVLVCKRLSSRCICIYTVLHWQASLSSWGSAALPDCAQRRLPAVFKLTWKFLPCKKQDLPEEYLGISVLKLCINCLFLTIIFLYSVLHCNDSCIQYYLCFYLVMHKRLCN